MIAVSALSIAVNVITGFPMTANIKWGFTIFIAVLGVFVMKKDFHTEVFKVLLFLAVLGVVALPSWFYGGGDNSITILYMLLLSVEAILMLEDKIAKWFIVGLCALSCIGMIIITYRFSCLVQPTGTQNVFMDSIVQVSLIFFILSVSIDIYATSYRSQHRLLETMASIDVLSGVFSRRKILALLEKCFAADNASLYVMMVDIDFFKSINDTYGHLTGDSVIQHSAAYLTGIAGENGFVGRYGGDEFMMVLNGLSDEQAKGVAARVLHTPTCGSVISTMSCGVSKRQAGTTANELISAADTLLLECKRSGRNRAILWDGTVLDR